MRQAFCALSDDNLAPQDLKTDGAAACFAAKEIIPTEEAEMLNYVNSIIEKRQFKEADYAAKFSAKKACVKSPPSFESCSVRSFVMRIKLSDQPTCTAG